MSENSNATDMQALTARTERLIDALTGAILSTAEVAAERIELASRVARIQQRMAAFTVVLEAVAAAKQPLLARLATAKGAAKALIRAQVEALTAQEMAVLERAGVPQPAAREALAVVDGGVAGAAGDGAVYVREGRRFVPRGSGAGTNGAAGNGGGAGE